MQLPDWRRFAFDEGVVPESLDDPGRLVVWLRAEREGSTQCWERVSTLARAEVKAADGLCRTAAASIRARQKPRGVLQKLLPGRAGATAERSWTLPSGEAVEQLGERHTDLMLVWPQDSAA